MRSSLRQHYHEGNYIYQVLGRNFQEQVERDRLKVHQCKEAGAWRLFS